MKMIIAIIFASIMAANVFAGASKAAYRVVSEVRSGNKISRERKIVRRVLNPKGRIDLSELAQNAWSPDVCGIGEGSVVVVGGALPEVGAVLKTTETKKITVDGSVFSRCSFSISGSQDGGDPAVRSVKIEGEGYVVIYDGEKNPVAGGVHIIRKVFPVLWPDGEGELQDEVENAWSKVP